MTLLVGCLALLGCVDPYHRGPTFIGGWNVIESKAAREIKADQPDGSSVRWAADCQYTLLGAFPYWGGYPDAEQARGEIMRHAPTYYTSTVEGESWINAWNFIFLFQARCVELAIRFDGLDEPNICVPEATPEYIECAKNIPADSERFDMCRQQGAWACRPASER